MSPHRATSEAPSEPRNRSALTTLCSKSIKAGTPETTGNGSSAYRQDLLVHRQEPVSERTGAAQRGQIKRFSRTIVSRASTN
ncbi:hypothetical protein OK015_24025 [Mycobacterium sp. Aquia_216]|uniref:hypothetical protein n=1 Tax=Mycobacterium sp. Aquia_216 TaxID=2991729 RepID=UPI00227BF467|nr:hypothetical protein [Mycobacterium sp. Aquia_216]WAJ44181.1 hypothetical protein OK015_24025 [Mycobacterium sp. Aquia_216]